MTHYVLLDKKVYPCQDEDLWLQNFNEHRKRQVKTTWLGTETVSTVFMGFNQVPGQSPPLVFETRVFEGNLDGVIIRSSSWIDAEIAHQLMVDTLRWLETH